MNDVCSIELLRNAVARGLSAEEEAALHAHLEHCEACCAQMEQLAGGEAWQQEAAALLSADELDAAVPEPADLSEVDFSVEHLDPSDDANVLGQLGGYDVLAIVGRGVMGVVLKAFDRELKRLVAIKALAPHLAHSSVARKRFAREAQAAAAVVNPHVIAIHHVQPTGRLPFLIMPLLTGESLAQRLKARGPLELTEVLRIGMQAATGLAAAHDQGLVHRDVKPANIFVEKGVERVVITDFGLARAADDVSMTRQGVVAGTPEYMSPEQARGEALDGRSDLFSLGCVLYEMATGVSPFRTDSTMATLRRIVDETPRAISSLNPELPTWFVAFVERLLAKDPEQRFASARIVSELLAKCLAHVQQPTTEALPKELEMNATTVPHLCWHEVTDEGPRMRWRRVAVLLASITAGYLATAAVLIYGLGVDIRWSTIGSCYVFVCMGLVTSVELERQRAIHGKWRFRFALNATLIIAALAAVGIALIALDASTQLEAIRQSTGQTRLYLNPNGGHIEGPHASVFYIRDSKRVKYVLFHAARFVSSSDTSGNRERGSITLTNGKTFGFDCEPPHEPLLQINGREYDLREGAVFELRDDGSLTQHGLFPTLKEAQSPDNMQRLIAQLLEIELDPVPPKPYLTAVELEQRIQLAGRELFYSRMELTQEFKTLWTTKDQKREIVTSKGTGRWLKKGGMTRIESDRMVPGTGTNELQPEQWTTGQDGDRAYSWNRVTKSISYGALRPGAIAYAPNLFFWGRSAIAFPHPMFGPNPKITQATRDGRDEVDVVVDDLQTKISVRYVGIVRDRGYLPTRVETRTNGRLESQVEFQDFFQPRPGVWAAKTILWTAWSADDDVDGKPIVASRTKFTVTKLELGDDAKLQDEDFKLKLPDDTKVVDPATANAAATSSADAQPLDRKNARSAVEAYVSAALAGRIDQAVSMAKNAPGDPKQIEGFSKQLNVQRLAMKSVYVNDPAKPVTALATSEVVKLTKKQPDGQRDGFLLLTLTMSDEGWFVTDIDFESEEGADDELKKFLEANPKSIGVPPLTAPVATEK